jgi:hypothetical protein
MQTVIRRYSGKGAKELFDLLEKRTADVEELMRSVKGFVGYIPRTPKLELPDRCD